MRRAQGRPRTGARPTPQRKRIAPLKVLFIGGTGRISAACAALAVSQGIELTFLNCGTKTPRAIPAGTTVLHADIRDEQAARAAIGNRAFDVVVNWVAYTAEHVATDIRFFRDRIGQYIFISSASAYQKPVGRLPIRESTPLHNPYWQYSRDKIAGEDLLTSAYRETGFPGTIVRPSHTYDFTSISHPRRLDGGRSDAPGRTGDRAG